MAKSLHDSAGDPRNASILISVNGELKPRHEAMVSVFVSPEDARRLAERCRPYYQRLATHKLAA